MKKIILLVLIFSLMTVTLFAQWVYDEFSYKELVSMTRDTPFPEAIKALDVMSIQFEGKKIINMSAFSGTIGIPVKEMYWKNALFLIINFNDLVLEDLPGSYVIKDAADVLDEELGEVPDVTPLTKQVKISSIFFKADKSVLNIIGIDWSTLFNGKVVASVNFKGAGVGQDIFNATAATKLESGDVSIDINTLFSILESHQKGTIIARPSVVVISGKKGQIQVGQDFSVKKKDDAGNVTDEFFQTGVIMTVTPTVVEDEDIEAIHLVASVQKSSATPGELSTIINKSESSTEVLLFDGEETVIGGLYDTDETVTRVGIPILKDLPWWVFGIRYLTGSNRHEANVREMIVIIKAEISKPINERKAEALSTQQQIENHRLKNQDASNLFNNDEDNDDTKNK
ncbi:MAG: type II and III secretion system protein [Candidatus Celaenobacter antarcticus]|nr:type II and III secretion system protein [Candidatus Celaenobacter antarcticus]MDP8314474.1 type II and III secretion system protein [Candidatus Celaenobacter antarcticus]